MSQTQDPNPKPSDIATRVRQGVTLGAMRYVLGISMALVIAALAITWLVLRA